MTTQPSPEQGAPQGDAGWAFRPRKPVNAMPGREGSPEAPEAHPPGATAVLGPETTLIPVPLPGLVAAQPLPQRGRGRRAGRISLALAVLAAAGGAAAAVLKKADGAPVASKQFAQVWQVPAPAAGDELIGSWLTGTRLIRASTRGGVSAYNLADGREVWRTTPTAKKGTVPCAMSPTLAAHGIGTVAFGRDGNSCTSLAGIDTATGKIVWTTPLVDSGHPTATAAQTYVQGDVATIVSENFLGGLDVRTGRRIWGFKARGSYCNAYDWGADGIVLVDDYCADSSNKFTLTAYDSKNGKVLWTESQSAHTDVAHIFSSSPLIASLHTAVEDSVRVFAPSGRSRKLAVGNTEVAPGNDSAADHSARLVGNILVTPAQTAAGSEIDGYDTATGVKLWSYRSAALATAAAGADGVYALSTSGPPQLVQLDPHTGHATPLARLPVGTGHGNFTAGTVYVTPDGGVLELNALGTGGGVQLYR
ncbi:outer membrane protein assembly factor BamB family protein [Actinacidiphila soli]|uniref:outer membrane protein assembly factor BamB family protein n=1 Tax=Actinacidiphila soli TaxID=2487275 RepID=UPI0013E28F8D|nr:PQQ-binding-like beta-propeller repeat protein [Actinacidiphila soli]